MTMILPWFVCQVHMKFHSQPKSWPNLVIMTPSLQSRSEEHTSELQSRPHLVCRHLLEKKKSGMRSVSQAGEARETLVYVKKTTTAGIYTLSLHDALPISQALRASE